MVVDLPTTFEEKVYATDASDRKGAFMSRRTSKDTTRILWRSSRRKGGYVRMRSRDISVILNSQCVLVAVVICFAHFSPRSHLGIPVFWWYLSGSQ